MEIKGTCTGGTLPRWLKGEGMRENLKGKVEVASRQKTRELGPLALLVRLVGRGQSVKNLGYPGRCRARREKRRGGEGSRERPPILSLHTT